MDVFVIFYDVIPSLNAYPRSKVEILWQGRGKLRYLSNVEEMKGIVCRSTLRDTNSS